jgi:hypothetical protein
MPKQMSLVCDEPPVGRRSRFRIALIVVLTAIITPPLYEVSLLCMARWHGLYGVIFRVETPVLNAIGSTWTSTIQELHQFADPILFRLPWKASLIVPIAIAWTGLAAWLLRKS